MATTPPQAEDFAYFYDTIHGRIAFSELPPPLLPPLRAALNSSVFNRLTRISQLGYTSLTFFSATQTRFSHAIGTLITMNRIVTHLWGPLGQRPLSAELIESVQKTFKKPFQVGGDPSTSVRCHVLLAALLQDVGELPFQKVTSLYFVPSEKTIADLENTGLLKVATPRQWKKTKNQFTAAAIVRLFKDAAFNAFDLSFIVYLITGQPITAEPELLALREMMDGTVDADRLDYVFRDAQLSIGSLTRADSVIRSIVRYEAGKVVVNDARPVTDFLTTRARLWTFVYSSPAVRFRQTLLKSFLQASFAKPEGTELLKKHGLPKELNLDDFLRLDDHSMLAAFRDIATDKDLSRIPEHGREALGIMVKVVTDYECRILARPPQTASATVNRANIPTIESAMFFDLLLDHDGAHKLYAPESVIVEQPLMERLAKPVPLEKASGALSSVFAKETSAPLVRDSYFLFLIEKANRPAADYEPIEKAMETNAPELYYALDLADVRREGDFVGNTWPAAINGRKRIAISCCFADRSHVIRIVRELSRQKEPYCVLLDSLLWLGNTSEDNSKKLITAADAVFMIMSEEYVDKWLKQPDGNIAAEVREILKKDKQHKVVLPLASYSTLNKAIGARWRDIDSSYTSAPILVPDELQRGDEGVSKVVKAACDWVNA
jgi:HD superfamily phosphohydrolase